MKFGKKLGIFSKLTLPICSEKQKHSTIAAENPIAIGHVLICGEMTRLASVFKIK